jgi:hypothetical protein
MLPADGIVARREWGVFAGGGFKMTFYEIAKV